MIIAILLDGSNGNKFYPGQNVTGNVRVETKEEIKMRGEFLPFIRPFIRLFSLYLLIYIHTLIIN